MRNKKTTIQHKRDVYLHILSETFIQQYRDVCELNEADGSLKFEAKGYLLEATRLFQEDFIDSVANETIQNIHNKLLSSGNFQVQQMSKAALAFANEAVNAIKEEGADVPEEVTLEDHEKEMISAIYDTSSDEDAVVAIRDAVANALIEEDKKSKEIKEITDLAKQNASEDKTNQDVINECVIDKPRNLMHAIITNIVDDFINENATTIQESGLSMGEFFGQNKGLIQDYSKGVYAIFESIQGFGWREYTPEDIKIKSMKIYKNK